MSRESQSPMMLPAFPDGPCDNDELVKVTAADTTAGFLGAKLVAGTNVALTTLNPGANETLQINVTGTAADEQVKVSANDTTAQFLGQKVQAGSDITITTQNPGGNENLRVAAANDRVRVSANDTQHQFLGQKLVAGTNVTLTTNNPGANETLTIAAAGGVTGFTGSVNTAAPNNTVNASRLLVDVPTTNGDLVLQPKGTGAIVAQLPDGTATGGNKRGANSIDLQTLRTSNAMVASGSNSILIGGSGNTATGNNSSIIGGSGNTATATNGLILNSSSISNAGQSVAVIASNGVTVFSGALYGFVAGSSLNLHGVSYCLLAGNTNRAMRDYAIVLGNGAVSTTTHQRSYASGVFSLEGDCQNEQYLLRALTTNAVLTELTANALAGNLQNRVALTWGYAGIGVSCNETNVAFAYEGLVIARRNGVASETAAWKIQGLIVKDATTVSFVGTPTLTQIGASTGATTWALSVTADTATNCLLVQATGETGKTIRWAAHINLVKVAG